eukprot:4780892-Pyramimonas_sp.AAC.1
MQHGVGWGHGCTKYSSSWKPQQVWEASIGRWSGRPYDLLKAEAERLSDIWETTPKEQKHKHGRPSPEALAELKPIT